MSETFKAINVEGALDALSLKEKVSLLSGSSIWDTTGIPSHGIPSVRCTDGPNGARGSRYFNPEPAICIPCGTGLGATWNAELIQQAGELLSRECEAKRAQVWLGPTVNIVRGPLNGRGFESFSEDPYLGGILAGRIISGVQSRGTSAALKHFVANDQETQKMSLDVRMSERALREVYLKPFQMAVQTGAPKIVMTSYNKVNGVHVSESTALLQDVLRKDWGFDGLVMSDWFGAYSCVESINAGLDIEMPGPSQLRSSQAAGAVSCGKISAHTIDERVRRVLEFLNHAARAPVSDVETGRDTPEDRELNRRLAGESVVLLKNETQLLPLDPEACEEVAIIGPNAKLGMACGGGSASLQPYYTTSVFQGIKNQLPANAKVHYEPGVFGHVLLPILTSGDIANDDGKPGVSIDLFNEPASSPDRKPFDSHTLPDTAYQLMDYWHHEMKDPYYVSMRANYVAEHDGPHDFGLAVYGVAKLYINDTLVIDNETSQTPGGMFFGQGTIEVRGSYDMKAGQSYVLRVEAGSASLSKAVTGSTLDLPGGALRLGGCVHVEPEEGIKRAAALAKRCRHVFVVAGLNADLEKEGKDRQSMALPPHVDDLISAVLEANPETVVVTQAGNPIAMPWRKQAKTMLHSWYGGNEAGNAVADVMFGKVNPSGKLPITFPDRLEDGPSFLSFGADNGSIYYAEDVFVGHRWFEARNIEPAFSFGHGLSYTTFKTSDIKVSHKEVSVTIENTGSRAGSEVLRLNNSYKGKSRFIRPLHVLGGFQKVALEAGEKKHMSIPVDRHGTSVWDESRQAWCIEAGEHVMSVVSGVGAETLEGSFTVEKDVFWNGL